MITGERSFHSFPSLYIFYERKKVDESHDGKFEPFSILGIFPFNTHTHITIRRRTSPPGLHYSGTKVDSFASFLSVHAHRKPCNCVSEWERKWKHYPTWGVFAKSKNNKIRITYQAIKQYANHIVMLAESFFVSQYLSIMKNTNHFIFHWKLSDKCRQICPSCDSDVFFLFSNSKFAFRFGWVKFQVFASVNTDNIKTIRYDNNQCLGCFHFYA